MEGVPKDAARTREGGTRGRCKAESCLRWHQVREGQTPISSHGGRSSHPQDWWYGICPRRRIQSNQETPKRYQTHVHHSQLQGRIENQSPHWKGSNEQSSKRSSRIESFQENEFAIRPNTSTEQPRHQSARCTATSGRGVQETCRAEASGFIYSQTGDVHTSQTQS